VVNTQELEKLRALQQAYFLPYYCEIVEQHPDGIDSAVVKSQVAQLLIDRFDIDIDDEALFGSNKNGSRADQWANNLVSNHVLDLHMLVAHRGRGQRATLYPGTADNSRPVLPTASKGLAPNEVTDLNKRKPTAIQSASGSTFRRSFHLAEYVRTLSDYHCAVDGPGCVDFEGRDGKPYVEVHHIVPMALQSDVGINLDRTANMAPLCPGCHSCLHRGGAAPASKVLDGMLGWFERTHNMSVEEANDDLALGVSAPGLMAMYGAMSGIS
jgi:hypothetical protein